MTTMRAVVRYAVDATADEKELALLIGLDDVIAELILDHELSEAEVEERCLAAIEQAMEEYDHDA